MADAKYWKCESPNCLYVGLAEEFFLNNIHVCPECKAEDVFSYRRFKCPDCGHEDSQFEFYPEFPADDDPIDEEFEGECPKCESILAPEAIELDLSAVRQLSYSMVKKITHEEPKWWHKVGLIKPA